MDLLGETADGELIHLALQSTNESGVPLRMAEYCLKVFRRYGRFPRQILVYIGEAPMQIPVELRGGGISFQYRQVDIRTLDGERLLDGEGVGDNVIAILAGLRDHSDAVRKIVTRVSGLPQAERESNLGLLLALAGLRGLEEAVEQEIRRTPALIGILENKVLGREFKRGLHEGERTTILRMIERRFGSLPSWAEQSLDEATNGHLEELATRILDAADLEELFA